MSPQETQNTLNELGDFKVAAEYRGQVHLSMICLQLGSHSMSVYLSELVLIMYYTIRNSREQLALSVHP